MKTDNYNTLMNLFIDYIKTLFPGVEILLHTDRNSRIFKYKGQEVEIADETVMEAIDGGWAESVDAKFGSTDLPMLEWQIQSFADVPAIDSPAYPAWMQRKNLP